MEMRKHGMINNWLVLAAVAVSWVAVQTGSGAAVENGVGVGMTMLGGVAIGRAGTAFGKKALSS